MNDDQAKRPERAIGTGARVMYPGEQGPPMGAGGSGSSTSGESSGSDSSGGSNLTMIGGAKEESSGSAEDRSVPLIGPLTALFGYPFWIFGKSVDEKADEAAEEQRRQSPTTENTAKPKTPQGRDQAERERLSQENARIQEELQRRAPSGSAAPRTSLSQELARLERSLGHGGGAPSLTGVAGTPRDRVDRNGDGLPDLWVYEEGPDGSREVLDEDNDGRADRVLHYDASMVLQRAEEDNDGDGRMETVSSYRDGQVIRKRADTDGDGQADSWSFFRGGEMVRHEIDRDRDGFRDLVMSYELGQLTEEAEDRNKDGRPDLIARYRDGEVVERREDLDFDGITDVSSFYESGKLVRRELRAEKVVDQWASESGS